LALIAFLQIVGTLGLQEAVSRFIPIYRDNREYEKLFGTILLSAGAVVFTGVLIIGTVQGPLCHFMTHDRLTLRLLSILILLAPIEAADMLLDALFASFAGTRQVFFRKYVLGPGLRLAVVVFLIWRKGTVSFFAWGHLFASVLGILTYSWMLFRLLDDQGLLKQLRFEQSRFRRVKFWPLLYPDSVQRWQPP